MLLKTNSPLKTHLEANKPIRWGKADPHLHTTYSDGYMSPIETVDVIAEAGSVDVVAITDHDTVDGAFVARDYARQRYPHLDVIIGQEVTTGDGDVLGLFLQATLPTFYTAAAAIEAIHQQGGLAIAAHPFVYGWGMESVGSAIRHLPFDAVEVRHGCPISIHANIWAGVVNRFNQQLPRVGSSDSHIPFSTGQAFTWFPGRTATDFRRAIEANTIRPGGTTWKIGAMLRKLTIICGRKDSQYQPYGEIFSE